MTVSRHTYSATVGADQVSVRGGTLTLDAGTVPHVQADLRVPVGLLDALDPRVTPRVVVTATVRVGAQSRLRIFDLGVRRRPVNHRDGTMSLSLASDEALLDDWRPLADDSTPATFPTIRGVVNYVLGVVLPDAVLEPGVDASATGPEAADDALVWKAGKSAMDFLHPLVQAVGMRLVCDERRAWTLRTENYAGFGEVATITYGEDLIDGTDTIDRDNALWFDAQVTRYRWTDGAGMQQEAVDSFALRTPHTRANLVEVDAPYPGPGRSAYAVRRAQQRGREVTATKVADWTTAAEQPVIVRLPDTPVQVGSIQRVRFDLSRDEMTIEARTIDTPGTAWILLPKGEAWTDSSAGESWIEETANG
ncbi:hypothetical protein [Microbacterium sp.]|uniref:hypothetical protein n=1 Tax=Microbacterium sp. TaxID=51671 RepID=UPI00391C2D59